MPSYFQSLEHLLRYCARPPFALERLSVIRGPAGRITQVRYVLPRHKATNRVGRGRGRKSTRPGADGVVELTLFAGRMPVRPSSQTLALAATALRRQGPGWLRPREISPSRILANRSSRSFRGSRVAHQPADRCGRAVDRTILRRGRRDDLPASLGNGYPPGMQGFDRITIDPAVCTGKPCVRGLRFPVSRLLGLLAAGQNAEEILASYPYLEPADIRQALEYAAFLAADENLELTR